VYKARWHGTLVAVKVLQSEDAAEANAFRREVSLLEGLHHLHVVAYYDHMVAQDGTVSAPPCNGAHGCTLLELASLITRLLRARSQYNPHMILKGNMIRGSEALCLSQAQGSTTWSCIHILPGSTCRCRVLSPLPDLHGARSLQVLLVTELMQGGDLRTRIRKDTAVPRKTGWYQNGRYIALGITRGLLYLHSRGVVWFDCKPNNVLLDHTGTVAKIADFGLSKVLAATHTVGCLVSPNACLALLQPHAWAGFLRCGQCGQRCRL
jgi:serine/threonine protein kinase